MLFAHSFGTWTDHRPVRNSNNNNNNNNKSNTSTSIDVTAMTTMAEEFQNTVDRIQDIALSGGGTGRNSRGRRGGGGGGGGGGKRQVLISKALSTLLRHQAQSAGIVLDAEGFAPLDKVVGSSCISLILSLCSHTSNPTLSFALGYLHGLSATMHLGGHMCLVFQAIYQKRGMNEEED